MRQNILHRLLVLHIVRTDLDPVLVIKSSVHFLPGIRTRPTVDIVRPHISAQLVDVVVHETDDGRVFEEVVSMLFALLAVKFAEALIRVCPVLFGSCRGH